MCQCSQYKILVRPSRVGGAMSSETNSSHNRRDMAGTHGDALEDAFGDFLQPVAEMAISSDRDAAGTNYQAICSKRCERCWL